MNDLKQLRDRLQVIVRERPSIFFGWIFDIVLIFMAFAVCAVPPLDLVLIFVLYIAGLLLFTVGI